MNAKPKTELNRCVFVQKRNSVNGALESCLASASSFVLETIYIRTTHKDTHIIGVIAKLRTSHQKDDIINK